MQREYKNVIFTDHAMQRLKKRRITQDMVVQAIRKPDSKEKEEADKIRFTKVIKTRNVHVIGRYMDDEKQWLVLSAWVRGEDDPEPIWLRVILFPIRLIRGMFRLFDSRYV